MLLRNSAFSNLPRPKSRRQSDGWTEQVREKAAPSGAESGKPDTKEGQAAPRGA